MDPSPEDHDPAAFSAEVARRVRAAVVSEVPRHRGLWVVALIVGLGAATIVVLLSC